MHRRTVLAALAAGSAFALGLGVPAAAAAPVKLTYWSGFTGGDKQAYEDLIKKFNDTHPDIQIDYQLQPNPCETGQRRLDNYQGTVLPEGQLMLNWSGGHQILRRKR